MVGLNRLSFWPKIKVSSANEETLHSAFIAQEAAAKQQNLKAVQEKSAFPREEIKQESLDRASVQSF